MTHFLKQQVHTNERHSVGLARNLKNRSTQDSEHASITLYLLSYLRIERRVLFTLLTGFAFLASPENS